MAPDLQTTADDSKTRSVGSTEFSQDSKDSIATSSEVDTAEAELDVEVEPETVSAEEERLLKEDIVQDPDVDLYDDPTPPLPPDGGYGWMIVFISFMTNLIVDGMCYMGGILYIELLEYFGESKSKTQWVHTLVPAVYLVVGPFVGALVNKFGCRAITIAGSIIASCSFVISAMAPCIEMMIFTYGIMVGVGFGCMYLPSVCFVSYYFDRKRALATGIAVCGSGIGTFLFPPVMNKFLNIYGWRGSLLLLAGMTLNICVFGALQRPLVARRPKKKVSDKPSRKQRRKEKKMAKEMARQRSVIMQKIIEQKDRQRTISTGSLDGTVITKDNTLIKDPALLRKILNTELAKNRTSSFNQSVPDLSKDVNSSANNVADGKPSLSSSRSQPSSPPTSRKDLSDTTDLNQAIPCTNGVNQAPINPLVVNKHLERVKGGLGSGLLRSRHGSRTSLASKSSKYAEFGSNASLRSIDQKRKDVSRVMYRQDIFYTGSVTSLTEYKYNPDMTQYVQSVVSVPNSQVGGATAGRCAPFTNVLLQMFDLKLFRSVTFIVLMANAFFSFLGFFVPFMFVPDLAKIQGASVEKSAILISILGICNTIGRVVIGWVADRPKADCLIIQSVALVVGGVSTAIVPLFSNYYLLAIYCAIFGTCMAVFIALRSIVTAEMLGIQKLNNAFGLTIFFQGIAGIAGAPLAGTIFDATGSYTVSFVIAGIFIAFSGVVCIPLRRIARWENSKGSETAGEMDVENELTLDDLPFPDPADNSEPEERELTFADDKTLNHNGHNTTALDGCSPHDDSGVQLA